MKTIKVTNYSEVPKNFTGIADYVDGRKIWYKEGLKHREDGPAVEWPIGKKYWYKEGRRHREDGPAIENSNGYKSWYLEGRSYLPINLEDYIVLDYYQGKYNIFWYKLLDKDQVLEYPDIPGLITK